MLKIEIFSHLFWWHFVCAQILVAHVCAGSNSGKLSSVLARARVFAGTRRSGRASRLIILMLVVFLTTLTVGCSAYVSANSASNGHPSITAEPAGVTVTTGQTATFTVAAAGRGPLNYQWQKNGAAISGATSSSYVTPVTTSSDNGAQFTVVVSNTAGSATSSAAMLTVRATTSAPSITTQPAGATVTAGQTASFSVNATGTAPLSYQWQKNGAAISGATSASYATPATTSSDNGVQFTVVVSNTAGSVTSSAATLTVNATTPASFSTWVAPSLTRVGTTDGPGTVSSIALFGARGETVDTQVVVQGPAGGFYRGGQQHGWKRYQ